MRRTVTIATALAAAGAMFAAALSADAYHGDAAQRRNVSLEAFTTVGPTSETSHWTGHVWLSAHRDGPTRVRGVLMGLLVPAVQSVRLGLTPKSCLDLQPLDIDLLGVTSPATVGPDGTAFVEQDDTFSRQQLRRARSVAVVGDWNGDGRDDIAACGDLAKHSVDWGDGSGRDVFGGAASPIAQAGEGLVLGNILTGLKAGEFAAGVIGLASDTEHRLALSRRTCADGRLRPNVTLGTFTTDANGSAVAAGGVSFGFGDGSVRFLRSMIVTTSAGGDVVTVACAPLQSGTLRGASAP